MIHLIILLDLIIVLMHLVVHVAAT